MITHKELMETIEEIDRVFLGLLKIHHEYLNSVIGSTQHHVEASKFFYTFYTYKYLITDPNLLDILNDNVKIELMQQSNDERTTWYKISYQDIIWNHLDYKHMYSMEYNVSLMNFNYAIVYNNIKNELAIDTSDKPNMFIIANSIMMMVRYAMKEECYAF